MYIALNLFVLFVDLNTKNMSCPPLMISKTIREQSNNYSNNFKRVHEECSCDNQITFKIILSVYEFFTMQVKYQNFSTLTVQHSKAKLFRMDGSTFVSKLYFNNLNI